MSKRIVVFGSSSTARESAAWEEAERCGRLIAAAGFAVVTGGYGGTMEAVSRGASLNGGHVIGVTAPSLFPGREGANPYVAEEIEAPGLTERIGLMTEMAAGAVALTGSIGTITELAVAWNLNHIARRGSRPGIPTVAVGREWEPLISAIVGQEASSEDVHTVETVEEGVTWVTTMIRRVQMVAR